MGHEAKFSYSIGRRASKDGHTRKRMFTLLSIDCMYNCMYNENEMQYINSELCFLYCFFLGVRV